MKKYGLLSLFFLVSMSFSACSNDIESNVSSVKKEKILRQAPVVVNDKDNLNERFGIIERNEVFLGERLSDSLISPRRTISEYEISPPTRMSNFVNNDETYYQYYEDPTQKRVLGVSYNEREGYLSSAKIDNKNYQRGYIENQNGQFFSENKGYIETYVEKYKQVPKNQGGYLEEINYKPKPQKGYLESLGTKETDFNRSNGYLAEAMNTSFENSPKNYLEAMGNKALGGTQRGYLESFGVGVEGVSALASVQKGYLENTFVDDEGLYNANSYTQPNSYLDYYAGETRGSGYLQNVSPSNGQRGYLESVAVFSGRPYLANYGF